LSAAAKGKQPARATILTEPTDVERTKAEQLKIVLKRSIQETHISQQRGSGTDEGTGSRPGVPNVPSDDSEEELSWDSSNDEDVDEQTKGREESEGDKTDESDDDVDNQDEADKVNDDDDDEEETTKIGLVKNKGFRKKKTQKNFIVMSKLTRDGAYKFLKRLKTLTFGVAVYN
nr:hypothetical protein [Tanacetum cinerariifolium]